MSGELAIMSGEPAIMPGKAPVMLAKPAIMLAKPAILLAKTAVMIAKPAVMIAKIYMPKEIIMARSYYIPQADGKFLGWASNFLNLCIAHQAEWGLPEAVLNALQAKLTEFEALYKKCQTRARSLNDTDRKNSLKEEITEGCQDLVNEFLRYSKKLSNEDRRALGLHVPDEIRSPIPIPAGRPGFTLRVHNTRELLLELWDEATGEKAIPYGMNGAVVYIRVGGKAPLSQDELIKSALVTKTRFVLSFKEEERGQPVYVALRWENERGKEGPWTEIQTTLVP
jgi:hypothetical protein